MSVGARSEGAQVAVALEMAEAERLYQPLAHRPPADEGLLGIDEVVAAMRIVLGDAVPEERLAAAAAAIHRAVEERWEQLPPEIHPDVGFNFPFVRCATTCWLGRQILVEGATFRVFRWRK